MIMKVKEKMEADMVGIVCGVNVVHSGCDMTPIEVEALVMELCKYFYTYSVSVRNFGDSVMTAYRVQNSSEAR